MNRSARVLGLDFGADAVASGLVAVVARAARSLLGEALATVDGLPGGGPEGDLGLLTATAANNCVHLTRAGGIASAAIPTAAIAAVVISLRLAC